MKPKTRNPVYELVPKVNRDLAEEARIIGEFSGSLPRVRCPQCEEVSADSFATYPTINITELGDKSKWRRQRTVSVSEFLRIAQAVETQIKRHLILIPGGELGPFVKARADKLVYDVEWNEPWLPFFRLALLDELRNRSISVRYASVPIRVKATENNEYAMPEAEPQAIMAPEMLTKYGLTRCDECGETLLDNPFRPPIDWLLLKREALVGPPHLFRVVNASGSMLVSAELAAALKDIKPTGLALKEAGEWI